jgi:adenosine deaminase
MRSLGVRIVALWRLGLVGLLAAATASAQTAASAEQRAVRYFESVRHEPLLALAFLRDMPKGGDLHNHLGGAIYAEDLIDFAAQDKLCVDHKSLNLLAGPCDDTCGKDSSRPATECSHRDPDFYASLVDAWSMRNWQRGHESGHDHFFATFSKFGMALDQHNGEAIANALNQAAADHLQYLELMHTIGGRESAQLGSQLGWNPDFAAMREKLLAGGLKDAVAEARNQLDRDEKIARTKLQCESSSPASGCAVTVRYLYQVLRGLPPEQVFAQILTGFELASADPRVVGFNLVMPEDWYVPMRDFDLHMKMIDYLHGIYPKVHISLHAGELAPGLVRPEDLRFHIRESVELGHAERIGHGVDVMNERDPLQLLQDMARRNVLVEICLTSNDEILGVKGDDHPLPMYRRYKVPVALATDDEGVSRSDLTHEYLRAVETYYLTYGDLKHMARESLEHSFLAGASLWQNPDTTRVVPQCAAQLGGKLSGACARFLATSDKAQVQWKLEHEFAAFEKKF